VTIDKIFFGYMALVGIATGAIIVAAPRVQDFSVKPYFWVVLAVILFDAVAFLRTRTNPGALLPMPARLLGFVIGIVLMVAIPTLAGSPARFF
jgi:hypothetical protein